MKRESGTDSGDRRGWLIQAVRGRDCELVCSSVSKSRPVRARWEERVRDALVQSHPLQLVHIDTPAQESHTQARQCPKYALRATGHRSNCPDASSPSLPRHPNLALRCTGQGAMVRFKHRYLLVHLVFPTTLDSPLSASASSASTDPALPPAPPPASPALSESALISLLRDSLSVNFGDVGAGEVGGTFSSPSLPSLPLARGTPHPY